jgi:tetratricopeptide (TPR) repeat protein
MSIRVFCSHRSVDKPEVEALAARLRAAGIDAWLDKWEILAGDSIVNKINAGLEECTVGLLFFSNKQQAGGLWYAAEQDSLTQALIEDGKRLIPVMIDADAPIPPLLRPRARRGIDEFDAIVDAIRGVTHKPPLAEPISEAARHSFVIHLSQPAAGQMRLLARLDERDIGRIDETPVPRAFAVNLARSLHADFGSTFRGAREEAALQSLEQGLQRLGEELGAVLLAAPIGPALAQALDALAVGEQLDLVFETAQPLFLGLAFEAARLPDGRLPALLPGVVVTRRVPVAVAVAAAPSAAPLAGPLKILVAVGAPDKGRSSSIPLDYERELRDLLDAVEPAAQHGNAQVRILEVGHPEEIRRALAADAYHVLHLSCHGSPGSIELEDEDGAAVAVSAAELVATLRQAGQALPLVFLSSCHGGSPAGEAAGFAQALVQAGVPQVLAMQTRVSDRYAIELAAAFYRELNTPERPLASRALAQARLTLEAARRRKLAQAAAPEYATAALYCAGAEQPLLDRRLDQRPLRRPPVHEVDAQGLPRLKLGQLIGRRQQMRAALAILRNTAAAQDRYGERAGVVLQGIGGVGKSALAGRIMARLSEDGWHCVTLAGAFNIDSLARALGLANGDDATRLRTICQRLASERLLLVLDNFESNLSVGGEAWLDDTVPTWLQLLCQSARTGRLLLTTRHHPPGFAAWLESVALPPLSLAETRKLILRLPELAKREGKDLGTVLTRIGGHPRMLEYLDALLRGGRSRLPEIRARLEVQAQAAGVPLDQPPADLDEAIAQSLRVGAHDVLLSELLALTSREEAAALRQAAVSNLPMPVSGVAHALHDRPPTGPEISAARRALQCLAELSLLVFPSPDEVFVHRWTAECLLQPGAELDPAACRATYARAGRYRLWRVENETRDLVDGMEAVRNLLQAQDYDVASGEALSITEFLRGANQLASAGGFAGEVLQVIPPAHPNYSALVDQEARALVALGLTAQGLAVYRRLQDLLEQRCCAEPQRADYQRDLSVSYERLGDLMRALGNGEAAREYFQKSLDIRERLARAEPQHADYQSEVSVSYEKLGNLMRALGNGEAAREYFQQSLDIRERLARAEPQRADYQRNLSVSCNKLGDLIRDLGNGEAAREYFQKGLDIAERLARAEPQRADYQRDLSVSYNHLGDLIRELGNGEAAPEYFQKGLDIAERLARAEPQRADYQRDLSVSYNHLGDLMREFGNGEAASEYFQKGLDIRERLAHAEPQRADYQRDLSISYNKLGDLMRALGNGEAARECFQNGLDIAERLARAEPQRADYQGDVVVSLMHMANIDPARAREHYARAVNLLGALRAAGLQVPHRDAMILALERRLADSSG